MLRAPLHRLQGQWSRTCWLPHKQINTDIDDLLGRTLVRVMLWLTLLGQCVFFS